MPIGLPDSGRREADLVARKCVGKHRPAVFLTQPAAVLRAPTYAKANEIARRLNGKGVRKQEYSLGPKIFEVEEWVKQCGLRVFEIHPEVSFRVMADSEMRHSKKSWAGFRERTLLLQAEGFDTDADFLEA